jgi:L-lactate dehydrogenase complex protein LldF
LNACPVYQQIGGHAYGSVYPGPIGAVITPQLVGIGKTKQLPYASSLCGACREVCPVKIDIPELLLHLRAEITEGTKEPVAQKRGEKLAFRLYSFAWSRPAFYKLGMKISRLMQKFVAKDEKIGEQAGFLTKLAPPLGAWTAWRDAPTLPPKSFREIWKDDLAKNEKRKTNSE